MIDKAMVKALAVLDVQRSARTVCRLGLEELEERYTGQWARWIPEMLSALGKVYDLPGNDGRESLPIRTGAFLDLHAHAHWQATQLQKVAELFARGAVKAGDVFWLDDIEFPGMEQIRYLARLSGIHVFIFGFLHAASYTREDFMAPMADIGQWSERAWIATCDAVFVGSRYHRQTVTRERLSIAYHLASRVHATGNPFRSEEVCAAVGGREKFGHAFDDRPTHLLFPHRPDREKRPGVFLEAVREILKARAMPGKHAPLVVQFTTGRAEYRSTNDQKTADEILKLQGEYPGNVRVEVLTGLTREAYYKALSQARVVVSTAIEENYGYAMVEAMALGCAPFMPNAYSYRELAQGAPELLYEGPLTSPKNITRMLSLTTRMIAPSAGTMLWLDGAESRIVDVMERVIAER